MQPRMSDKETDLFLSFVRNSDHYLEFGVGGSTVVAAQHVGRSVIAVESSQEWIDLVMEACAVGRIVPSILLADIGPTARFGYPTDEGTRPKWPRYHEAIWEVAGSGDADLYLVDGRFRVACFAQVILHCRPDAVIGLHDFTSRSHYHRVRELAREVATAEDMSFFLPRPDVRDRAQALLAEYRFNGA